MLVQCLQRTGAADHCKADSEMNLRSMLACIEEKLIVTCSALHAGICREADRGMGGNGREESSPVGEQEEKAKSPPQRLIAGYIAESVFM